MNSDKLEEEAKAGVFDVRQPTYRLLALNLRARRYDGGLGFSLVPWQPILDRRIGPHITGVKRGDGSGIEWSFGRKRELGL
ncbi:DUF3363 domain-containing protein [Bradyrhizobium rifense]|uniref:DUF3363 domain-containing protein n=1 Tax=Bradyrhizobium rifense TaxID=515499 RepID=A0A5D3KBA7_9BRAD|nr:DUF3363 domain-containing protein [Bradyrhizobium rifense]